MGYKFSLALSREITDDESAILRAAGCDGAIFGPDSLPTNADVPVTKMDFDVTASPSLAEAIESALEAVKNVPDLSVPGLTVPAQPAQAPAEEPDAVAQEKAGAVAQEKAGAVAQEKPAVRKPVARKPGVKRTGAKKASAAPAEESATVQANGHAAPDPVEATDGSD